MQSAESGSLLPVNVHMLALCNSAPPEAVGGEGGVQGIKVKTKQNLQLLGTKKIIASK